MAGLPYVEEITSLERALKLVATSTSPREVTVKHLAANGFDPVEAKRVRGFLQALGLVSEAGTPSPAWLAYRDSDGSPEVLADLVRAAYPVLLERIDDDLLEVVRESGGVPPAAHELVVATFRALCDRARLTPVRPAPVRARQEVLQDVSALLQMSVTEFETARQCLANDLTRPAHVAAWNSLVALGFAHLSADDFAALRTSRHRASLPLDDLMRAVHARDLIRVLVRHGLVTADDKEALDDLLRRRNDCAHPMRFAPGRAETADYLSAILSRSAALTEHPVDQLPVSAP